MSWGQCVIQIKYIDTIEKYKKLMGEEYSFKFEFSVNGWSKINS